MHQGRILNVEFVILKSETVGGCQNGQVSFHVLWLSTISGALKGFKGAMTGCHSAATNMVQKEMRMKLFNWSGNSPRYNGEVPMGKKSINRLSRWCPSRTIWSISFRPHLCQNTARFSGSNSWFSRLTNMYSGIFTMDVHNTTMHSIVFRMERKCMRQQYTLVPIIQV